MTAHITPQQVAGRVAPRVPAPPRATPSGRRLSRKAGAQIQTLGVRLRDVDETIDHPHSVEQTHQHNGHLFIRGRLGVIVPHDEPDTVVAIFHVDDRAPRTPRPRRSGGGPARKVPTSIGELERMLRAHGFEISTSGRGHFKATHPDRPGAMLTIPHTPSDRRSWLNLVADIRRNTGIDITTKDV